jgi:rRNA-processing protein FCF1
MDLFIEQFVNYILNKNSKALGKKMSIVKNILKLIAIRKRYQKKYPILHNINYSSNRIGVYNLIYNNVTYCI